MDIGQILQSILTDYTLRTVALGSATLGMVSGALGSFAVLRRQSMLGDAISHAALPGVVVAFLLTRSKEPLVLIFGALLAGWLATLVMLGIVRNSRIKEDSALGLTLSVFFGLGLMLLTYTQRLPDARQAGLDKFLFGQAATMLERDVAVMATLGGLALLVMAVFWKELKLLAFDAEFGISLGFPMDRLNILLTTLLVVAIVIGLQSVGVVLMSAMVVAPAAAARQWTDRLTVMVLLAGLFGALAGVSGTLVSGKTSGLSTGPTIVLAASLIVFFSLFFAPNRGMVWNYVRQQRNRRILRLEAVLADLYTLAKQHEEKEHAHAVEVLQAMNHGQGGVRLSLVTLEQKGLVRRVGKSWALTAEGLAEARTNYKAKNGRTEKVPPLGHNDTGDGE